MRRSVSVFVVLMATSLVGSSCSHESTDWAASMYERDVEEWRLARDASLRDSTYLKLVGLDWLETGSVTVGSDPQSEVRLPIAQGRLGAITVHRMRDGDTPPRATFTPATGADVAIGTDPVIGPIDLRTDLMGDTTVLRVPNEGVSFYLIERNGRLGVRSLDEDAPTLTSFDGVDNYPVDPRWRVEGRFEPFPEPRTLEVADVAGGTQLTPSPGRFLFDVDGVTHSVHLIGDEKSRDYWLIFSDTTNGSETYGAGRYLYSSGREDDDGTLVVDFNRAYNPPCAFNPYATCPLPPPENRLSIPVRAGEKDYHYVLPGEPSPSS